MTGRSWRWLRTRIEGLLTRPLMVDAAGNPRYSTRIQTELWHRAPAVVDQQQEREAE